MRVLLSGVIGAVASTSAWKATEHFMYTDYGWMVCFVGLVTGFCMHKASCAGVGSDGSANAGGFARGALAVVITLAAIVGGQKAYTKYLEANSPNASAVKMEFLKDRAEANAPGGEGAEENTAPEVVLQEVDEQAIGLGQSGSARSSVSNDFSDWDMIWMSLAALAAYVTGKGGDKTTAVVATEEPPEEAADEPQETPDQETPQE